EYAPISFVASGPGTGKTKFRRYILEPGHLKMTTLKFVKCNRVMQFGRFLESLQTIRCFKKDSKIRHSFGCHQYQSTKITMSAFLLCVYVTSKLIETDTFQKN
ncbi:11741_t:CDS:2, partial [Entrophospora sp. SA101]